MMVIKSYKNESPITRPCSCFINFPILGKTKLLHEVIPTLHVDIFM